MSAERLPGQPLLTIAVPTYNREFYLMELLEALQPQLTSLTPDTVELLIADNCSEDLTHAMVASFQDRGLVCRYIRNQTNIGSDANFALCFNEARGQYVWLLGDDDLPLPNAVGDLVALLSAHTFDLVYLSSFSMNAETCTPADVLNNRAPAALVNDKLGRFAEVVHEGPYFLERVNALVGLISVIIVNKNKLRAQGYPPLDALNGTNLMQLGWVFPLLGRRVEVLYVWQRLLAYRSYNSGGWGIAEVFGTRLARLARQYFAATPQLADALMNGVLRYWMCNSIMEMRQGQHATMTVENFAATLRKDFGNNARYWIFVWPVATWPLPLAKLAHAVLSTVNRFTRITQTFARHAFHRGEYLRPEY